MTMVSPLSRVVPLPNGLNGGFLKWWYPTTMRFPTKNDHFGVFCMEVPPFKETPKWLINQGYSPLTIPGMILQVSLGFFSASQRSECSRLCQLPWPSNGSKHATENDGWHSHWKKILLKKKGILYVITYWHPHGTGDLFLGPLKKKTWTNNK